MRHLGGSAFWLAIRQLSLRLGFVFATLIMASRVSVEEFAKYAFFVMTINLFASYATLGVSVSASNYFAIARKRSSQQYSLSAIVHVFLIMTSLSLLAIVFLPKDVLMGSTDMSRSLLAIGIIAFALDAIPGGAAMGLEKYRALAATALLYFFTAMAGVAVAANFGSVHAAIWVWIIAATVRAAGSILVVIRSKELWKQSSRAANQGLVNALSFVGPLAVVSIFSATALWLGGWMHLNIAVDSQQYPQYAIGLQWFALGLFFPQLIAQTIIPRLAGSHAQQGSEETIYLRRAIRAAFLTALLACIVGSGLSIIAAPFYGNILEGTVFLIPAFLFAALPYAMVNTTGNALVASGDQWAWLATSVAYQVTFLALSLWWIEAGAIAGAMAIGTAGTIQCGLVLARAKALRLV